MPLEVSCRSMLLGRVPAAAFACLVSAALAASCGGGGGGSNDSGGNVVNGSSRIGWDQRSDSESDLVFLHFVIYVDGARTELGDASCSTPAGSAGFPCTATLPSMSAGQHTLALASYVFQGAEVIESAKSAPLTVTVSGSSGSTAGLVSLAADSPPVSVPPPSGVRDVTAADGTQLRIQSLTHVDHPSALAISNDGTVFVADREGRVLVLRAGTVVGETDTPRGRRDRRHPRSGPRPRVRPDASRLRDRGGRRRPADVQNLALPRERRAAWRARGRVRQRAGLARSTVCVTGVRARRPPLRRARRWRRFGERARAPVRTTGKSCG